MSESAKLTEIENRWSDDIEDDEHSFYMDSAELYVNAKQDVRYLLSQLKNPAPSQKSDRKKIPLGVV